MFNKHVRSSWVAYEVENKAGKQHLSLSPIYLFRLCFSIWRKLSDLKFYYESIQEKSAGDDN